MVKKIKVALVGIGNCFSGLIQGIEYYRKDLLSASNWNNSRKTSRLRNS